MRQERRTVGFVAALLSTMLGCGGDEASTRHEPGIAPPPTVAPEADDSDTQDGEDAATPSAEAQAPAAIMEIGYAALPEPPGAPLARVNRQALAAHESGDSTTSRTLFTQLVAQSGGDPP